METARQFVSDLHSVRIMAVGVCRRRRKKEGRERDKTEVAAIIMIFPFVSTVCPPREGCLKKRRRRRKTVERNNESLCVTRTRRFLSSFFFSNEKRKKGREKN